MNNVQATLASFPGLNLSDAYTEARKAALTAFDHIQVCPQSHGAVDQQIEALQALAPSARLRLHANVRVTGHARHFDASSEGAEADAYFKALASVSESIKAPCYTLHAGEHRGRPLEALQRRILQLQDVFAMPVGVEGHYPDRNRYWLQSWEEMAWLLNARIPFALDLSHLNIIAHHERKIELGLTRELLASEYLIEVHISHNDGRQDSHAAMADGGPIWWDALLHGIPSGVEVFYEGHEMRGPAAAARIRDRVAIGLRREKQLTINE